MRKATGLGVVSGMSEERGKVIACHECDLLQREIRLKPGCTASCSRCGAVLYRNATASIDRALAYALSAVVLFLVANSFPIFSIETQGDSKGINLYGAVAAMWEQDMKPISVVVFITAIVVPAVELVSMIYLLLPLKLGRVPKGYAYFMRTLQYVEPWGMVEVLMLGVLVSLVKLTNNFKVIPGIALWSFGALTLLLAAVAASFSAREVWDRIDRGNGRGRT